MTEEHKGGPPQKARGGLNKVLYVRADEKLLRELERLRQRRSERSPGVTLSRSDLARAILWEAIERESP